MNTSQLKTGLCAALLALAGAAHAQSIIGGWYFASENTVYTFAQNNEYYLVHDFGPVGGPGIGTEIGQYTWDSSSGLFQSPGYIFQSDGSNGLFTSPDSPAFSTVVTFSNQGNTISFNGLTGTRVVSQSNPIVGSWVLVNGNPEDTTPDLRAVVTALDNGQYYFVDNKPIEEAGDVENGMEHGTYTWNPTTGAATFTVPPGHDTDEDAGLNFDFGHTVVVKNDLLVGSDESGFSGYFVRANAPINTLPVVPPADVQEVWTTSSFAFFFNDLPNGAWADPTPTDSFYYQTTDGAKFLMIGLPNGGWDPFGIYDGNGNFLGTANPGSFFTFASPTDTFRISGILPTVDAEDPTAFPLQVFFDTETADFLMSAAPIVQSGAVPEPTTYGLWGAGLLVGAIAWTRRRSVA